MHNFYVQIYVNSIACKCIIKLKISNPQQSLETLREINCACSFTLITRSLYSQMYPEIDWNTLLVFLPHICKEHGRLYDVNSILV
jgi:hypothetical protein